MTRKILSVTISFLCLFIVGMVCFAPDGDAAGRYGKPVLGVGSADYIPTGNAPISILPHTSETTRRTVGAEHFPPASSNAMPQSDGLLHSVRNDGRSPQSWNYASTSDASDRYTNRRNASSSSINTYASANIYNFAALTKTSGNSSAGGGNPTTDNTNSESLLAMNDAETFGDANAPSSPLRAAVLVPALCLSATD